MKYLLLSSGAAILYCIFSALLYEILAARGVENAPPISTIVEAWIGAHNLIASIIFGTAIGFSSWLIIHWWFNAKR